MLKKNNISLAIILFLGTLLRLLHITKNDLWFDEVLSIPFPINGIYHSHPLYPRPFLLYNNFLKYWTEIFGRQTLFLRLPSALFSISTMFLVYLFAKKLFGNYRIALIATAFFAFSPFQIWYAQEARNYPLAMLFSILAAYFLYSFSKNNSIKQLLCYYSFAILGAFTHPFCIILNCIQSLFMLLDKIGWRKKILILIPLLILPFIFYKSYNDFIFLKSGFWIPIPNIQSLIISLENMFLGYTGTKTLYILIDILLALAFALSFKQLVNKTDKISQLIFCLISFFLPIVIIYYFSIVFKSLYLDRGFIIFTPYYYIWLGYMIEKIDSNMIKKFIFVSLIFILSIGLFRYYTNNMFEPNKSTHHIGAYIKKPFKPLSIFLQNNLKDNDIVLSGNMSLVPPLYVYLDKRNLEWKLLSVLCAYDPNIVNPVFQRPHRDIFKNPKFFISKEQIYGLSKEKGGKIFFLGCDWARSGKLDDNSLSVKGELDKRYRLVEMRDFNGINLCIYKTGE
ncbi:MAG: glycosyltransferase family 39 protein [Candidatus Omnitrophica bacterium]|nr:glycosyltransferase family 39 protein [Candidatus Omnitrophota bacterium]MBU1869949.1 glycosyltransferase family 39 protein [Candidatus Omnitrophota bacterium]